jgi:hypothetical protein
MNFMDSQKLILESLAMDLKRVALGLHRGSIAMANRFQEEAFKRIEQLTKVTADKYIQLLISKCTQYLHPNNKNLSEDALMLSTLFQNYSLKIK